MGVLMEDAVAFLADREYIDAGHLSARNFTMPIVVVGVMGLRRGPRLAPTTGWAIPPSLATGCTPVRGIAIVFAHSTDASESLYTASNRIL
jgi:hypothetical protein